MKAGQTVSEETQRKARVFISYSRKDREFTTRLSNSLVALGYIADFDQSEYDTDSIHTGISAEDEWWKRLQEMIAAAEAMLFVVSPDSVGSSVCDAEIAFARSLGKRVIPLLLRPIDFASAPPGLKALNVKLSFVDERAFESSLTTLSSALDVDVAWHREGARLMALAVKWDSSGRPDSQLLPAGSIVEAETWIGRRPAKAEPPGNLLGDYLAASAAKAKADRERLLQITGRAFVRPVEQALDDGRHDFALRLAAAGILLSEDLNMRLVPERARSAVVAASENRLRAVVFGREQRVQRSAISPDGALVVIAYSHGAVCVIDTISGCQISELSSSSKSIADIGFSPDGDRIIGASEDGSVGIWEARSGRQLAVIQAHRRCSGATFSADGSFIITTSGDSNFYEFDARVWDATSGRERHALKHKHRVLSAAISPNGAFVVTTSSTGIKSGWDAELKAKYTITEGSAHIWDTNTGRETHVLRGHGKEIKRALISPDCTRIVTLSDDRTIKIWESATGRELFFLQADADLLASPSISISDDSKKIVIASTGRTGRVWDMASGRECAVLRGHEGRINSISFQPNSHRVVTASSDNTSAIWDSGSGRKIATLYGLPHQIDRDELLEGNAGVKSAAIAPDGARAVTLSYDGTTRVWDAASGLEIATVHGHGAGLNSAIFYPDGARILTSSDDGTARLWDATNGRDLLVLRGGTKELQRAATNQDGSQIITTSFEGGATLWDAVSGRRLAELRGHSAGIASATFSADGTNIVTSSFDKTTRLWDAQTRQEIAAFRHEETALRAEFSPAGDRVVTAATDGVARVWEIRSRCKVAELRGHEGWVSGASFSQDGARIITSSYDGTARLWEANSGRQVAVLRGHQDQVLSARLSADGTRAVTASADRTARIWDVENEREVAVLRGHQQAVKEAAFDAAGDRVVTASADGTARIWDVRRTRHLLGDVSEVIAASLSNGRGVVVEPERQDLLMRGVKPEEYDLEAALISQLERRSPGVARDIAMRAEGLTGMLHANCYLASSTTDLIETGIGKAGATGSSSPVERPLARRPAWVLLLCLALGVGAMFLLLRSGFLAP